MRSLIFLATLAAAAPAAAAGPHSPTPAEARGHDLVARNCGMCHAIGRTGASPNPASPPFRDLTQRYKIDDLGEALAEGIITGHPAMPEFHFAPKDVDAIIAYIKSIQSKQTASAADAAAEN